MQFKQKIEMFRGDFNVVLPSALVLSVKKSVQTFSYIRKRYFCGSLIGFDKPARRWYGWKWKTNTKFQQLSVLLIIVFIYRVQLNIYLNSFSARAGQAVVEFDVVHFTTLNNFKT